MGESRKVLMERKLPSDSKTKISNSTNFFALFSFSPIGPPSDQLALPFLATFARPTHWEC